MFWGFGYQSQSTIDGVLEKPDVTLEMLLEEEDLIPECKGHHTKLIELYPFYSIIYFLLMIYFVYQYVHYNISFYLLL